MRGLGERQVQDSAARNKKSCLYTVFPQNIKAMGDYYYFAPTRNNYLREGNDLREGIISNITHWKVCSLYFLIIPLNNKRKNKHIK